MLAPVSGVARAELGKGRNPTRSFLVDFVGSPKKSVKLGLPVYRVTGTDGFIWIASMDAKGRGSLSFRTLSPERIYGADSTTNSETLNEPISTDIWSDCKQARQSPEKSIGACTTLLSEGPVSCRAEAFHSRGTAFAAQGDLGKAISDISEGIRLDPDQAYRFQERGELLVKKGEFRSAITDFNEAIRMDPNRAFRWHSRANAYLGIGDLSSAIADFSEAIRRDPDKHAFRYYDRANAFRAAGQYEQSIPDYTEVLELEPTNAWALVDRGRAYLKLGQNDMAKRDFDAALKLPDATSEFRQEVAEMIEALSPEPEPKPPKSEDRISASPTPPTEGQAKDGQEPGSVGGIARLLGEWNNDATGDNIIIRTSALGFEAIFSNLGQASLALASRKGANLEISGRDVECLYFVTFIDGGRMNWQLREGPEEKCIKGQFVRVVDLAH